MRVNFILTCFDKEDYIPHAVSLIKSYKNIQPEICVSYNGDGEYGDVKIENQGLQFGEHSLIKSGYEHLKNNGVTKWVKLSVDSWLCDENIILNIFNAMHSSGGACYAGNFWNNKYQFSTDIFFADTEKGNIFENFNLDENDRKLIMGKTAVLENFLFRTVQQTGKAFIVWDREPVHPNKRNVCEKLKWTMSHDLQENINNLNKFKNPVSRIEHFYKAVCSQYSDIFEHIPTLRNYAEECDSVTEFGVRTANSTWAFLSAKPKRLRSYDINDHPNVQIALSEAKKAGIDFEFKIQNVIEDGFEIEETDLLFIDTLHTYEQLKQELAKHANKAKKYIIFHDTVSFGNKNENEEGGKGLLPAIEEFLLENSHWQRYKVYTNNNGLTVLKRYGTV